MPPRAAKKRLVVDDDDDENASVDTKTTKQARTASTSSTRAAPHDADAHDSSAEDEQPLLRGSAQTPKANQAWRGGDDRRRLAQSPTASSERRELTFLPAFRRGIRLAELSKQRSFYGRTDSIVGGWARPPSERLALYKSGSNKARARLKYAFLQCAYFTQDDSNGMLDLLMARYANAEAAQRLGVEMPEVVNIVHDVLLPELLIELVQVACGCETTTREQAIEFLNGKH
jgi:hypothetical protein